MTCVVRKIRARRATVRGHKRASHQIPSGHDNDGRRLSGRSKNRNRGHISNGERTKETDGRDRAPKTKNKNEMRFYNNNYIFDLKRKLLSIYNMQCGHHYDFQ